MTSPETESRSGFVAIIGRPNVGKSTLINQILGEKISITSRKPQTTRHKILGVKTLPNLHLQIVFVDTPGLHKLHDDKTLNRMMNKAAKSALHDVDAVIFVVEGLKWTDEDEYIVHLFSKLTCPVFLAVNKVDAISDKDTLLPYLQKVSEKYPFKEVIPISAKLGTQVEDLIKKVGEVLPLGPFYFPEDQVTDRTIRFRVAELIRKELIDALGQELPYATTVEIESMKVENNVQHIHSIIWVEREGQKAIVIGKGGETLKKIGTRARLEITAIIGMKVHLVLWVKVKKGWSDDEKAMKSLGILDIE